MAQQETQSNKPLPTGPGSPEFAAMAMKGLEGFAEVQTEFMKSIREANQRCLEHMQSEATLASELIAKLAASHSASDTAAAYQDYGKRRMELLTADGQSLMAESQKLMEKAARLFSNGFSSNGRVGGGT